MDENRFVPEILSTYALTELSYKPWSEDLSAFFKDNVHTMALIIETKYERLLALKHFYEHGLMLSVEIADMLYLTLSNEIERIYTALTLEYNAKYNYYRNILEENSGENNNTYSGSDQQKFTGNDKTNTHDSLDVDNNVTTDDNTISSNTYDTASIEGLRPISKDEHRYNDHMDYEDEINTNVTYGKIITDEYGKKLNMKFGRKVDTKIEGNNGIYPFPDLIKKEYDLRLKHRLCDTIISLLVKEVSSGVWDIE